MIRAALALACLLVTISPLAAQTVEELKAELQAQKVLNDLLKQRIATLEGQLTRISPVDASGGVPAPYSAPPPDTKLAPEEETALERAFEQRGFALLPPYRAQIIPGLFWEHSGYPANGSRQDIYGASLGGRLGLPAGFMIGASIPYARIDRAAGGSEWDLGNLRLSAWKSLLRQDGLIPRVVANVDFSTPVDNDNGLRWLRGGLLVSKNFDPIAIFGSASYMHSFDRTVNGAQEEWPGTYGLGFGAGLAVTPDISMTAGFDFTFRDNVKRNGATIPGSAATVGVFTLGGGFVLRKDTFLSVSAGFGMTDQSPDALVSVSLPFRF